MPTLLIQREGSTATRLSLEPGSYSLGCDEGNSIILDHPSVAGHHCDLTVFADGGIVVRDAGSPQGTLVDGQRVGVGALGPGQVLSLGEIRCFPEGTGSERESDRAVADGTGGAFEEEGSSEVALEGAGSGRGEKSGGFWRTIPGAFAYPLRGDGWIPLVIIVALEQAPFLLPGALGVLGLGLGILIGAYLLQLAQAILLTTAEDPEAPLPNPDVSFDPGDLRETLGTYFALVFVCFGPAIAAQWIPGVPRAWGVLAFGAGCLYFPMALLAVLVTDRVAAMSPTVVVPSIRRAPAAYLATAATFGAVMALTVLGDRLWTEAALPRAVVVGCSVVSTAVGLYLLVVWLRILGLFYRHHREQLAWDC